MQRGLKHQDHLLLLQSTEFCFLAFLLSARKYSNPKGSDISKVGYLKLVGL